MLACPLHSRVLPGRFQIYGVSVVAAYLAVSLTNLVSGARTATAASNTFGTITLGRHGHDL